MLSHWISILDADCGASDRDQWLYNQMSSATICGQARPQTDPFCIH